VWLARSPACAGYVVIVANHHGNAGLEPYRAEGYLCWWERETDMTTLLLSLANTGFFADRLNLDQVSAVGFSLGEFAVLAASGADIIG
jgi:predicted dienelactone hydrolase